MTISAKISQKPTKIADKIKRVLESSKPYFIQKIEVKPPGFINLFLSPAFFSKEVKRVLEKKDSYGKNNTLSGSKIMVEFAHPNTHKQFHIGHLRNIATGEAIVRILAANSAKVIRTNYQGDVGLHIAKCLYGIKLQTSNSKLQIKDYQDKPIEEKITLLSKAYVQGNKAYQEDEKAKQEISKINQQIYADNPQIRNLLAETKKWSLEYFDQIYTRLYTHFDRFYFESEVADLGKKLVLTNLDKIFVKSKGAIIFPGEKFAFHNRVFITKLNLPTYEAKDIGLAKLQFEEYNPDLIIHVVGPEQTGYFQVVFEALAQVFPNTRGRQFHLAYGWVRLKKGKMSSRAGTVIAAPWLIDEIKKRLKAILKEEKTTGPDFDNTLEAAAVASAKYSFLKVAPQTELVFDINQSINLAGDSGPYLQYTYARCQSVLKKSKNDTKNLGGGRMDSSEVNKKGFPKIEPEELTILRTFYKYPEVVADAAKNLSPNLICSFLYDLAQKYNTFYNTCPILKAESKTRDFRLALTAAVSQILASGLNLLAIKPLEKM